MEATSKRGDRTPPGWAKSGATISSMPRLSPVSFMGGFYRRPWDAGFSNVIRLDFIFHCFFFG